MQNLGGHERPNDPTFEELSRQRDGQLLVQLREWVQQIEQLHRDVRKTLDLLEHRLK